jgi:hypothetical protein
MLGIWSGDTAIVGVDLVCVTTSGADWGTETQGGETCVVAKDLGALANAGAQAVVLPKTIRRKAVLISRGCEKKMLFIWTKDKDIF